MGFIQFVKEQMQVIKERDPAIHSNWEVFLYPSFKVMLSYRRAHKQYLKGHYFRARWISQRAARKTGIEIHPGAQIGKGFFIDHGTGVIIGETTIIGDNVPLYQGVTLGGTGKETGKRHPTIEDNVMISAGAKVIGSFTVGENSKIGAGSVVIREVPPNSTVVGVPGQVVKRDNKRVPREDLNQTDLPDPIFDDICNLQHADSAIVNHMLDLENQVKMLKGVLRKAGIDMSALDQKEEDKDAASQTVLLKDIADDSSACQKAAQAKAAASEAQAAAADAASAGGRRRK